MLGVISRGAEGGLRRRAVLGAMVLGTLAHSYVFGAVLQHETFIGGFRQIIFEMSEEDKLRYATLKRLLAMIPEEASVAATEMEVPHIAARISAFTLKDGDSDAEFILVNSRHLGVGRTVESLRFMMNREPYRLLAQGDDLYLFRRGPITRETKDALARMNIRSPFKVVAE
jgi:hypothetical protein